MTVIFLMCQVSLTLTKLNKKMTLGNQLEKNITLDS